MKIDNNFLLLSASRFVTACHLHYKCPCNIQSCQRSLTLYASSKRSIKTAHFHSKYFNRPTLLWFSVCVPWYDIMQNIRYSDSADDWITSVHLYGNPHIASYIHIYKFVNHIQLWRSKFQLLKYDWSKVIECPVLFRIRRL